MKFISLFLLLCVFINSAYSAPLKLLENLVVVNSGSQNVSGINKVQKIIREQMVAIGLQVQEFKSKHKDYGDYRMLVGEITGESDKYISLIAHSDTVFEQSHPFQELKISPDKKTATGPGVIDGKGGIVVALEGLRKFLATNGERPKYSLRLIISPSEEIGSPGFHDKLKEFSQDSLMALGFEPSLVDDSIIEGRRGNRWYLVKVKGREAHAGRGHREGINACHDLSHRIVDLSKLTNYKKNVTLSVGHIEGGRDKYNTVCGSAEAKIDTRFSTLKDANDLDKKLRAIIAEKRRVCADTDKKCSKATVTVVDDAPPFSRTKVTEKYIQHYMTIIERIEKRKIMAKVSGGAADTNYMSREGLIIIDGLGASGGNMHTAKEFIKLKSLQTRSQSLAEFLNFAMNNL